MLNYYLHKFDENSFRLVMTLLVKDEADIIETNIRCHAALGVDAFIVMDNDSSDGTYDIVKKLQSEYEIILVQEDGIYDQAKWMTGMAHQAGKKLGADWVISNDADEFWIPKNSTNLKRSLAFRGSVLTVQRYNMLLDHETAAEEQFSLNHTYYVRNPVYYRRQEESQNDKTSIALGKIGPKTIVNPNGLLYIRGGNHKALHIGDIRDYLRSGYDKIKRFDEIEVFHYPFRSYRQFFNRVKIAHEKLTKHPKAKFGPHMRRWSKIYAAGNLEAEFNENILFSDREIRALEKFAIVQKDEGIRDLIRDKSG